VWTGRQALERRLVDRLGSLEDALALARERAGLRARDEVEVRRSRAGGGGPLGLFEAAGRALSPAPPLAGLLSLVPELAAAALLAELGPVLALPVEWVAPEDG
jgi:protease-4